MYHQPRQTGLGPQAECIATLEGESLVPAKVRTTSRIKVSRARRNPEIWCMDETVGSRIRRVIARSSCSASRMKQVEVTCFVSSHSGWRAATARRSNPTNTSCGPELDFLWSQ
jgi:hypothetical protein